MRYYLAFLFRIAVSEYGVCRPNISIVKRAIISNFICAALFSGMAMARNKEEATIIPPPLVRSAEVSIPPGTSSRVFLRVSGHIVEPMQFLIRKPPRHGILGEIQRVDRNTAVVVYTPLDAKSLSDDSFAYAAKAWDSPVSAAAVISLHVVQQPAALEAENKLDFGTVFLGDQTRRTLSIRNTGGATARGKITANPPWRIEGSGGYVIPGGAQWKVSLVFEPKDERDFQDRILLSKGGAESVQVSGSGTPPVSWPKEGLQMTPEKRGTGIGISFSNNTPYKRDIHINWPDLVNALQDVSLAPSASQSVHVAIKEGEEAAFEGDVQAASGNFTFSFPLKVYPAQPRIGIAPSGGVMLVEEGEGQTAVGNFTVSNTGGANLSFKMTLPPGMGVAPDPKSILLGPGQTQQFSTNLDLRQVLTERGEIFLESPSCSPVSLSYEVKRKKSDILSAAQPVEKFLSIPTVGQAASSNATRSAGVDKIWLLSAGTHEVSIVWKETPEADSFRVERRTASTDPQGRLSINWLPWPEVKFDRIENSIIARFEHLPANSRWTIRIIGVDSMGIPGTPSPAFQIATVPSQHFSVPVWIWIALIAGLIAAAIRISIDQRRAALAREDERIAKLEKK